MTVLLIVVGALIAVGVGVRIGFAWGQSAIYNAICRGLNL